MRVRIPHRVPHCHTPYSSPLRARVGSMALFKLISDVHYSLGQSRPNAFKGKRNESN